MRFEDVDEGVLELLHEVIQEFFPELRNVRFKCLFDLKKRTSGGKLVLASIKKTNDLLRHLTAEEARVEEGFDFIVSIDQHAWENIGREDRIRILRHELQHVELGEEGDVGLKSHDFEDFAEEVARNTDDPGWRRRVATLTEDIYAQEKEMAEAAKKRRR